MPYTCNTRPVVQVSPALLRQMWRLWGRRGAGAVHALPCIIPCQVRAGGSERFRVRMHQTCMLCETLQAVCIMQTMATACRCLLMPSGWTAGAARQQTCACLRASWACARGMCCQMYPSTRHLQRQLLGHDHNVSSAPHPQLSGSWCSSDQPLAHQKLWRNAVLTGASS